MVEPDLGELLWALVGCAVKEHDSSSRLQQRENNTPHIEGVMNVQIVYKWAPITTWVDYFGEEVPVVPSYGNDPPPLWVTA